MARILSRRANGAPHPAPLAPDAPQADQPTVVAPALGHTEAPAGEQPTAIVTPDATAAAPAADATPEAAAPVPAPAEAPAADSAADAAIPAGADTVPAAAPSFRDRGRLRRRLRYLRRVREIGFRDLGGLVFDLDRFGRERPDLVQIKLEGLGAIDAELRALEDALGDVRDVEELREPGIAACPACGALHGSDARFCPACGVPTDAAPAAVELPATAPEGGADPEQPAA